MAKGYYETGGSDYLNDSPPVKRESSSGLPSHNHDERYYTKEETDVKQDSFDGQFQAVHDRIDTTQEAVNEKAPINHIHSVATASEDGFMSFLDKQALNRLTEVRTNIHLEATNTLTLAAETGTKLLFNVTVLDSREEYDKPTDIITIERTGMYMVAGTVEVNNTAVSNGRLFLQVYQNGALKHNFGLNYILPGMYGGVTGSTCLHLQEGDEISFYIWSSISISTRGKEYVKVTRLW